MMPPAVLISSPSENKIQKVRFKIVASPGSIRSLRPLHKAGRPDCFVEMIGNNSHGVLCWWHAKNQRTMEPIRNSAKAIIIKDGRLLAIKHMDDEGPWFTLPGGGQDHGETLAQALERECQEEIGSGVYVGKLRYIREYIGKNHEFRDTDGDAHQVEFLFECHLNEDYPPGMGANPDSGQVGMEWLPLAEIENVRIYPKILRNLLVADGEDVDFYLGDVN